MTEKPDLAALLGARICHDLISPLGAISNGVELLLMGAADASPEVALIAESIGNANARIRYFRVAFGGAVAEQRVGRPEILSILADTTRGGRLVIDWSVPGELPRPEVKLAFLLLQCCEAAMPYGGRILCSRAEGRWRIAATAQKMKIEPQVWEVLSNPQAAHTVSAAQVQFALAPEELQRQGRRLSVELAPAAIILSF